MTWAAWLSIVSNAVTVAGVALWVFRGGRRFWRVVEAALSLVIEDHNELGRQKLRVEGLDKKMGRVDRRVALVERRLRLIPGGRDPAA